MNDIIRDVVFAWRNALKKPGAALLIVVTLALGIGANTAIFSVTYHVLMAPLPYVDGERLVRLMQQEQVLGTPVQPWSSVTFGDFQTQNTAFEDFAYYANNAFTASGQGLPEQVRAGEVSANFFPLLGIATVEGRGFLPGEDTEGAKPVMLLSHDFWLRKFSADPGAVGTALELNGVVVTIVGVLPRFPAYPYENDIWVTPAGNPYSVKTGGASGDTRKSRSYSHVFGKLKQDVSIADAAADIATITQRLRTTYPDDYSENYSVTLTTVKDELVGESAMTFALLFALALLIVLIASANVANLSLANVSARGQELAVREAVGANPARMRKQLLTESLLLALAGGVLGLIVAYFCLRLFAEFAAVYTPLASEIMMDARVFTFALGLAMLTGVLSSASTIFTRRDINKALKEGGHKLTASSSDARKRQSLLAVQFALALVMLTTSMLIMLSLYRLNMQDTGYRADGILAVSLAYNVDLDGDPQQFPRQIRAFGNRLLDEVHAIPGVDAAALLGGKALLQSSYYNPPLDNFRVESWSDPDVRATGVFATVSDQYFSLMDISLLRGRMFTEEDIETSPLVALVNANFADRYFPDGDVIGQHVRLPFDDDWVNIIGVVANVRPSGLNQVEGEAVYYNYEQMPGDVLNMYIRSSADLRELGAKVKEVIHSIGPRQSVGSIAPLAAIRSAWLAPVTVRAVLTAVFGVLALIVTLSGVIGVLSYNISQRVHVIGVHMAIGANPANIQRMFIMQGLKIYALGLSAGFAVLLFTAPMLEPLLYQTRATNPAVYVASAMLLTIAVFSAMYFPTRKASHIHPAAALQTQ